jgi:peptidoglycan hydrolase-like protein with peptidoglycan-binding domain
VTKLVKPAQTITKTVPVDYFREVMTEVTPATQKRVPVPAQYEDVEQQVLVSAAKEYCTQVLCDVNASQAKISEVQSKLQAGGFYVGPIDGVLGPVTYNAVAAYQKAKGLSEDGYLTVETLNSLGVSLK